MPDPAFGDRLRVLRAAAGLTQQDLAVRAGLNRTHLARLELGAYPPSREVVRKLAAALEVEVDVLRGETAPPR